MARHCCRICCSSCCYSNSDDSRENLIVDNEAKDVSREIIPVEIKNEADSNIISFPLPQPLLTGHYIFVEGSILLKCTRFAINFQCGNDKNGDKALHFNPRLEEGYIVRNSYINEKWGEEENWYPFKVAYTRPGKFKVAFFIAPDEFLISIGDKHYSSYKHRLPVTKITHLTVNGFVNVEAFYIRESSEYPAREIQDKLPVLLISKPKENKQLPIPYTAKLPDGLGQKWQLEMIGKVKLLPQSFFVSVQRGMFVFPHSTVPLHFNPRFYAGEYIVVRNAYHDGAWGAEERCLSQFFPGHKFHLIIRYEIDEFSIWVNGKMTGMFKSKERENTIVDTIHTQGDIILYKVWVNRSLRSIIENMEQYHEKIFNEEKI